MVLTIKATFSREWMKDDIPLFLIFQLLWKIYSSFFAFYKAFSQYFKIDENLARITRRYTLEVFQQKNIIRRVKMYEFEDVGEENHHFILSMSDDDQCFWSKAHFFFLNTSDGFLRLRPQIHSACLSRQKIWRQRDSHGSKWVKRFDEWESKQSFGG